MIRAEDLHDAIAECQGKRNPDASTCVKLAAYYIILDHINGKETTISDPLPVPSYSFAADPEQSVEKAIDYWSDTEFAQAIDGRKADEIWKIIDELMSVLQATNVRLYNGVMRKINE